MTQDEQEKKDTPETAKETAETTETTEAAENTTEATDHPTEEENIATEQENAQPEEAPFSTGPAAPPFSTAPVAPPPPQRPVPQWHYTAMPQEKGGFRRFIAVFVLVFGLAIALLIGAMFLGQSGFHFVQHVETKQTVYVREYDPASGLLTPNEAADRARQYSVAVSVHTSAGTVVGTGFVWREDGYILTNHHVIETPGDVQVLFPSGEAVDAAVVGSNADADVAVLHVDRTGLTAAPIGQSSMLLTGDDVVAIGTPATLNFASTATFGKVSYPARIMTFTDESGVVTKKMTLIQTDTSVNPGNSGGPLVDMYGRVVGIIVMKVMNVGGADYEGIGFAIPIDGAVTIAEAIVRDGVFTGENPIAAPRTLLGLSGRGLEKNKWYSDPTKESIKSSDTETAECTFKMPEDGIYVMSVSDGGAVGKVYVGDIITRIDGLRMYTIYDVINAVNRRQPGEVVTLTLLRPSGGGYNTVTVEVLLTSEY